MQMQMKMKFARLLATGAIALAGGLIATVGIAGAQSVPVQPPVTTNPPVQPAQPPQSPVEPPSNGGNVGGAGTARLPTAGTAGDNGAGDSTTSLAFGALAVALAAGGVASWRLGRRVH
jgi:hypothetical protein